MKTMKISIDNPVLQKAIDYTRSFDKLLDNLLYLTILNTEKTGCVSKIHEKSLAKQLNEIENSYYNIKNSDDFYKITHKYLPLDLAIDLNIQMAKYLVNNEIEYMAYIELNRISWQSAQRELKMYRDARRQSF